jgi:hypothetical protein
MEPRPEYVPWTHQKLHPGLVVDEDQIMTPAPESRGHQNRAVVDLFEHLHYLYYTKKNWKRLLQQYALFHAVETGADGLPRASVLLDTDCFDLNSRDKTGFPRLHASSATHTAYTVLLFDHGGTGKKKAAPPARQNGGGEVVTIEFATREKAHAFADGVRREADKNAHRPKAVVFGPYALKHEVELRSRVDRSRDIRRRLGVGGARADVIKAMLFGYPIPPQAGAHDLRVGRTGVFVTEVPVQHEGLCLSIGEFHERAREWCGGDDDVAFRKICTLDRTIPLVALFETLVSRGSGLRIEDSFITFRVDEVQGHRVKVSSIHITAIVDDLGVGEPLQRPGETSFDTEAYLQNFHSKYVDGHTQRRRRIEHYRRRILAEQEDEEEQE